MTWIRVHGKGRVFYSGLGHAATVFMRAALLQHFLAGIQYALGDLAARRRARWHSRALSGPAWPQTGVVYERDTDLAPDRRLVFVLAVPLHGLAQEARGREARAFERARRRSSRGFMPDRRVIVPRDGCRRPRTVAVAGHAATTAG